MSNILPIGNLTPERGRNSSKNDELLRTYYGTVFESFAMLHKMGFAQDPGLIRAAMGMTEDAPTAQPSQQREVISEQAVEPDTTNVFSIDQALKNAYAVHEDIQREKPAA